MKIFITGHKGQLGRSLLARLESEGHTIVGGDLPEWNLGDYSQVLATLRDFRPEAVIHAAALTAVDYCAENPDEALRINGFGSQNVALACREVDALLLAISTNEVFDGRATRPYQEYDLRSPINPYGYSKYVGEQVVERFAPNYMIVRTSWLFAPGGANFIHRIIARAREGQPLKVVTDEIGCPTYAVDLADALARLLAVGRPGIYHLTNSGECSRYDFAREILRVSGLDLPIEPIRLADFSRPSTPPPYAPLANSFAESLGVTLRPWQAALAEYINLHESPEAA